MVLLAAVLPVIDAGAAGRTCTCRGKTVSLIQLELIQLVAWARARDGDRVQRGHRERP